MGSPFAVEHLEGRLLLAASRIDSKFGTNGTVSGYSEIFPDGALQAVAVQADGKIIAAGGTGNTFFSSQFVPSTQFALARFLADGSLDRSFGTGGKEVLTPAAYSYVQFLAVQKDGKIVIVGPGGADSTSQSVIIGRLNADGTPDAAFGISGFVTDSNPYDVAAALNVQPDGKIVVAANFSVFTGSDFSVTSAGVAVLRYTAAGTPDATFGISGRSVSFATTDGNGPSVHAMALGLGGNIVIEADDVTTLSVERLTLDGTPDPNFGRKGVAFKTFKSDFNGNSIAVQRDGRLVVIGAGSAPGSNYQGMIATRFTAAGAFDRSFGKNGVTVATLADQAEVSPSQYSSTANAQPAGLAVQRDGKLVVGAYVSQTVIDSHAPVYPARFAAIRMTADGRLDSTFGSGGKMQFNTGNVWPTDENYVSAVALAPDGSIVLAGSSEQDGTGTPTTSQGFELLKVTTRGTVDTRFGYQGRVGPFPIAPPADHIAIQSDGKILLATAYSLARLSADGSLDTTFGRGGLVLPAADWIDAAIKNTTRTLEWLSAASDGEIFLAYQVQTPKETYTELRRLHSDGSLDRSFGSRRLNVPKQGKKADGNLNFDAIAIAPDGKIVLVSTAVDSNTVIVTRYNANGNIDRSFGTKGATALPPFNSDLVSVPRVGFDSATGEIIVGGAATFDIDSRQNQLFLTALDHTGKIDPAFKAAFSAPPGARFLDDMSFSADGSISVISFDGAKNLLSRYLASGAPDPAFGSNGTTTPAMTASTFIMQPDGTIASLSNVTLNSYEVAQFTSAGVLDTNFGDQGIAALPPGMIAGFFARAPDGSFIVVGSTSDRMSEQIVRLRG